MTDYIERAFVAAWAMAHSPLVWIAVPAAIILLIITHRTERQDS